MDGWKLIDSFFIHSRKDIYLFVQGVNYPINLTVKTYSPNVSPLKQIQGSGVYTKRDVRQLALSHYFALCVL